MNSGEWLALAALAFTVVSAIAGGMFKFGQHSQRLASLEERAKGTEASTAALAVLTSTVGGIDKRLEEVAHDVKNLLLGRVKPARREE
jgi:hypothetical protein